MVPENSFYDNGIAAKRCKKAAKLRIATFQGILGKHKEQKCHGDTPKQTWRRKMEQLSDFGEEKVSNGDHND